MTMTEHEIPEIPEISTPIHSLLPQVLAWLQASGVDPAVAAPVLTPMLSEQSFESGDAELRELWREGIVSSWLGGPAIEVGTWPADGAGRPLVHVASISLAEARGIVDEEGVSSWSGAQSAHEQGSVFSLLPATGSLEVFHDLATWGFEPGDGDAGGWLVRWVDDPTTHGLVEGGEPPEPACQQVMALPGFTLRSSEDAAVIAPGADPERYLDAYEQWQLDWLVQRFQRPAQHPVPTSRVGGHPSHPRAVADEILAQGLPLGEDDEHLLVLEVESWTSLAGWFGDAGSLEVWMRRSDLEAGAFDRAWCLIRTD